MLHYSLLQRAPPENHCVLMAASLKLLPGSTVRWRGRRYLIVDYQSLDAIIARQPGKRRLERIPVNEAAPDHASHIVSGGTPDLVSVPEKAWRLRPKDVVDDDPSPVAPLVASVCAMAWSPASAQSHRTRSA
jgi:hypothetical protein